MRGLAAIERNGRTQARMIADLLDMSRLNMGKLPLVFAMIDPAEELSAALGALQPAFEDKDIRLEVRQHRAYRPIRADALRLHQVIWNLVTNAIKFSPRGSVVTAALTEETDGLRLEIVDTGQGIAADFLPFVFDRFAQSDAASNRSRGGLGLGLAIVRQLVEAHGGRVGVHSEGLGHGSTFEVWLPVEPLADDAGAGVVLRHARPDPGRRRAAGRARHPRRRRRRGRQRHAADHPGRPRRPRARRRPASTPRWRSSTPRGPTCSSATSACRAATATT